MHAVGTKGRESAPGRTSVEIDQASRGLLCAVALALVLASYWLLNYSVFPRFDHLWTGNREASAIASGIVLSALAFCSYWRPWLFGSRPVLGATVASALGGGTLTIIGLALSNTPAVVVAATLGTVAVGLASIVVGLSCLSLDLRAVGLIAIGAYVGAYALRALFALLAQTTGVALFFILPLASVLMVARFARPVLDQSYTQGSPAELALTSPASFLPFEHRFFLTLLLFRFIYGFTLTFGELERTPLLTFGALVPLAAIFLWALVRKGALSPETLFQLSILCSVAGFLLITLGGATTDAANLLLTCGTGFFEMFMYYMLIALSAKNPLAALPVMAWGSAMASWGTLLGANFGRLANGFATDPLLASGVIVFVVFFIVAYLAIALDGRPFTATLQGLAPLPPQLTVTTEEGETISLEKRCEELGRLHELTAREQEVFEYLARGRNIRFIEEELVVSYNTVKTHVSHIYAKLGVHSHQELINLVENADTTDRS